MPGKVPSVARSDKSKPYIPLAGGASDGWSNETEATATCFCGKVQLKVPLERPGLVDTFICHCTDCRKITASMFTTAFTVRTSHLTHLRGEELLSKFSTDASTGTGNGMTNHFCSSCGTLMYRTGTAFPGMAIARVGTVDDFNLAETKLKPRVEQYNKDRVAWLHPEGARGVKQVDGYNYGATDEEKTGSRYKL